MGGDCADDDSMLEGGKEVLVLPTLCLSAPHQVVLKVSHDRAGGDKKMLRTSIIDIIIVPHPKLIKGIVVVVGENGSPQTRGRYDPFPLLLRA